jgi:GDP-L-fucose synthase
MRDAARAFVLAAEKKGVAGPFNLGSGKEWRVYDVAMLVADACGWSGSIFWDETKPNGQPRRVLDSGKAERELGWKATTPLADGLRETLAWWESRRDV